MFGWEYSFKPDSKAYPRYKFFRSKLKDLFLFVNAALEENKLTDFVSQGLTGWKSIKDNVEACINQKALSVCVFSAKKTPLDLVKDLVRDKSVFRVENKQDEVPEKYDEKEIHWKAVRKEGKGSSRFAPQIIVYIKGDTETAKDEESDMDLLPQIQKEHLIVFKADTRNSTLYTDFHESGDKEKNLPLCQNIEFLLEQNVVILLQDIECFISKFVPKIVSPKKQRYTIKEQIITDLKKILKNEKVLGDLLPDKHDEKQIREETKDAGSSDLEEKVANEKRSIFHSKIRKFVSKKVKCRYCDLTAQKLGVSGTFMNEFIGEKFFPFESKLERLLENALFSLPPYLADDDLIKYFVEVTYICEPSCSDLIIEAEVYMQKQLGVLRKFKQIQFEMYGLLRQSQPRANKGSFPPVNTIPKLLQNELLGLDSMEMCGTLHGTLTLIVNQQPTSEMLDKVSGIIQRHQYPHQYEIAVIEAWNRHTLVRENRIEHGHGIFPEFCEGGKAKLKEKFKEEKKDDNIPDDVRGSIGCFVESGGTLYAVTCFHCVEKEYFKDEIRVQRVHDNDKVHFGVRSDYWLYEKYTLDIALIEVDKDMKDDCDKSIVKEGGIEKDVTWNFFEVSDSSEDLESRLVYKRGSTTGITGGFIVSHDFKTKHMKKLESEGFNEHRNIFIDSHGTGNFSEDGDSGSVVCMTEIPVNAEEQVKVISLLCGSITLKNFEDGTKSTYSYSCPIKKMLEDISKQKNCSQFTEAR